MKNYIDLAHSTSAPVQPCRDRLHGALLAMLYFKLREFDKIANDLDQLKRAIFYGNPLVSGNMTIPPPAQENAMIALANDPAIELLHAGLGMATESGEFLASVFDHLFGARAIDPVNIGEEIGDTLWYLAKACRATGTTLELEQVRNIQKLAARYPNKFTDADALNRDLAAEREVLEAGGDELDAIQLGAAVRAAGNAGS